MFFVEFQLLMIPIFIAWGYFFFKQRDIPLLVVSALLLFLNWPRLLNLPGVVRNVMTFGLDYSYALTIVSIVAGICGLVRSIKGLMVTILKSDSVVDRWYRVVAGGAGKGNYVLGKIESMVLDARMPGVVTKRENVAIELFGEKRTFLIVSNLRYKEFKMYINARDLGTNLDVSWYFMVEPRYLKKRLSKYATGNPQDLSMSVSLFAQQDISAFKSITHEYVISVLESLYEELKLDPSGLNTGSRGFLNVW